jgi:hypothetical protein
VRIFAMPADYQSLRGVSKASRLKMKHPTGHSEDNLQLVDTRRGDGE